MLRDSLFDECLKALRVKVDNLLIPSLSQVVMRDHLVTSHLIYTTLTDNNSIFVNLHIYINN